ncbi:LamB/YcsF family protein [Marinobacter confluentis]|nr:LamB/YcsF family protein [Marinobacter confluentis]
MDRTVRQATARMISVGAHPAYPDLLGFGRRQMELRRPSALNTIYVQDFCTAIHNIQMDAAADAL